MGAPPPPRYAPSSPGNLCLQLEQRLVMETQGGGGGSDMLPRIETEIRARERASRSAQLRLDRSDCWDTFLFSKTLRRDPRCRQLNDEWKTLRQRLPHLHPRRRQIMGEADRRSMQHDIIRELARNGCASQYTQEA